MIENLKDLKALFKLCRQNGVTEINWGTVSFKLGGDGPKPLQGETEELDEQDSVFIEAMEAPMSNEELVAFSNGVQ